MFGKGIYLADSVSKSAQYCAATPAAPHGLLLVCEAALGNALELRKAQYVEKLPRGKHSVKGCGKTVPARDEWLTLDDGVIVPLGAPTTDYSAVGHGGDLQYNEYIVYDEAQVQIKYLLKVRFEFAARAGRR